MENGISRLAGRLTLILGCVVLGVTSSALAASPSGSTPLAEHVPGELIVKLKPSFSAASARTSTISALSKVLGAGAVLEIKAFETDGQLHKVRLKDGNQIMPALQALGQVDAVEYAEPNYIYRISAEQPQAVPNDPDFAKLWGLKNTGQTDKDGQVGLVGSDINVSPLWDNGITGSRDIVVAVIDTGIDVNHPDLKSNIWVNAGEIPGNGIDDDGNGFIDDVHGWNFASKTNDPNDDHSHGSHCAGTIGGSGNDGVGIVGVNWQVSMMALKFLQKNGSGTLEAAVESINYARQNGAHIISASWSGGGFSQTLFDAIAATRDAGILFVAAAGNDRSNTDMRPAYPASFQIENIIAVAATDNRDGLASFSNYGARTVHVAAPGKNILSCFKEGGYGIYSGTSMAAPHVSGIAALLLSANRAMTFGELKTRLIQTSDPVRLLRSKVSAKGRVDAENAFNNHVPPTDDPPEELWRDVEFALESDHPYASGTNQSWEIHEPGAQYIRVVFEKAELETNYDKVMILDASGTAVDQVTGKVSNHVTEYVKGDRLTLRLTSDSSVNWWGFKISKIQVIR